MNHRQSFKKFIFYFPFILLFLLSLFFILNSNRIEAAVETIGLVRQDCAGYTNCYTSLSAWEAAYGGITFGACAAGDLVCADKVAVAQIDGAWTSADTTAVIIDGWTTDVTHYIRIYTTTAARHSGKWDTGKYRFENTSSNSGLVIRADYTRIDGLQITLTPFNSASNIYTIFIQKSSSPFSVNSVRITNNIIRDNTPSNGTGARRAIQSFDGNAGNLYIYNNIIYGFTNTLGRAISGKNASGYNTYVYNNTVYNNTTGIASDYTNIIIAKNNIANGNTTDYSGTFDASSSNNISQDATSPNVSLRNLTVPFVDATNKDFHLSSSDTSAKDAGTNLSADANLAFSDDIDGNTRPVGSAWDIGADEYTGVAPPPPSDTTPPILSSGSPTGALPTGTTQTTLSLATNENSTCKYGIISNTAYGSITNTFTTTGVLSHSSTITGLTNGTSYNYYVRCSDASGNANTTDYTISFSVASPPPPAGDTTPPTVSITSPINGTTVSGTITISANASDNVGIAGVQFKLDTNTFLGIEDTTSPYSYSLNTTTITDGSHTLIAVARDTSNNYTTSSIITITVNNASPPPPDTTPPSISTGLIATVISSSQINLSWTASTDPPNGGQVISGVTGYKIYRCAGSACTPTVQIATSATNSYSNTGLTASTAYTYAVSAYDAAGNESAKSIPASAATQAQTTLEIPLTIEEPAGIARTNEPVTSGIPLPQGTIVNTQEWSLWDGAIELPLQVTRLSGRTPWILLDFQVSLNANQKKTLTLKQIPSTTLSSHPLTITEDTNQITISNNIIKTTLSKTNFNLLEEVWLDKNNNQSFDQGEQIITPQPDNIQIIDSTTKQTFSGKGTPTNISWEYQGPLRSTLRVDGRYTNGATEFIAYTTRLTFYAGRSDLKIEHILRNSYQPNERHVKVKSATLKVGIGSASQRVTGYNSLYWVSVDSGGITFDFVPSVMGISYVGDNLNVDDNGGWLIPDLTHQSKTVVMDFREGLSVAQKDSRLKITRSPLLAIAPGSWYSEYAELSTTKFSTLDDEKQAYQKWGWTYTQGQVPWDPHKPDRMSGWADVHGDTESDDTWQNLIMYLRTGSRGYWDRTTAWASYYRDRYPYRTDNFPFAWSSSWESPKVNRPSITIPLTSNDQAYLNNDVNPGKIDLHSFGADHLWGWGLIDYYYLTGDVEAINAAKDLGEVTQRIFDRQQPGTYRITGSLRQAARHFLLLTRLSEVTQDPQWQSSMDHMADLFIQSPDWDARGIYVWPRSGKEKSSSSIHLAAASHVLSRYYQLTGKEPVRQRIIQMADFAKQYALHPSYLHTSYWFAIDYPNPGDVWYSGFDEGSNTVAQGYTAAWIDTLVRAYRLTNDITYLERAKFHWDRASKAIYGQPYDVRSAGDNEVGMFINDRFLGGGGIGGGGGAYYLENGHLPYAHLLFYEYSHLGSIPDSIPPSTPTNLTPTAISSSQINLSWTASMDNVGVAGYKIYRNSVQIATTTNTGYSDAGLSPLTTYTYTVAAYDAAGNVSPQSSIVSATTQASTGLNPILVNLANNTWVKLNPQPTQRYKPSNYDTNCPGDLINSSEPVGRSYSGVVYGDGKIMYFGGGHGSHPGNDVEMYDIVTNTWTQQYKPECPSKNSIEGSAVYGGGATSNLSPMGRPYVEHSYQQGAYNPVRKKFFYSLQPGTWTFDLATGVWTPVAGKYAGNTLDPDEGASIGNVHITSYDPGINGFVAIVNGQGGSRTFLFKNDKWERGSPQPWSNWGQMYSTYVSDPGFHLFMEEKLWRYNAVNQTWTLITSTPAEIQSAINTGRSLSMAYDKANKVVVFTLVDSSQKFITWVYDPIVDQWIKLPTGSDAPASAMIGTPANPLFVYDSIHNIFIFSRVTSVGSGGTGGSVETWAYRYKKASSVPDTQAPFPPANLIATPISSSQINLSWTASMDNVGVAGYKIYRCAGSTCSPTVQIATSPTNSYSNTGLTASTAYTYAVSAYDSANNESAKSSSVSATTQSPTPQCSDTIDNDSDGKIDYPLDPDCSSLTDNNESDTTPPTISSVISTTLASTTARIDWTTNEPSTSQVEYGFTIQYGTTTTLDSTLTTSHSVSLSNLSPDSTTYNYRARSKDSSGNESISTNNTFITPGLTDIIPPASTTNLKAENITQTSVDLVTWTAPGDDGNQGTASSYDIRYTTGELSENTWNNGGVIRATGEPTPKPAGSLMAYTLVGLTPNTTYKVALKTLDEVSNQSLISNIITFTTLKAETAPSPTPSPRGGGGGFVSDTTPPDKPEDFKAISADKQITLLWKNPTDTDFVRVVIVRKEASAPTSKEDGQVIYEGDKQEYTDINLDNDKTYYYAIYAYDKKPNYSTLNTIAAKPEAGKISIPLEKTIELTIPYPNGSLLKTENSDKIYFIVNNKKRWIVNPEVFISYGFTPNSQITVQKEILDQYPEEKEIAKPSHSEGTLVRAKNDFKVYIIKPPFKRHIFNPAVFTMYKHFNWNSIREIDQDTLNSYITSDLYRAVNDPKVYSLEEIDEVKGIARKRWLDMTPEDFVLAGYNWNQVFIVNPQERDYYQTGTSIMNIR